MPESTAIEMIPLTVVSDVDFIPRNKNGVSVGIVEAGGVLGAVFNLEAETKSISAQVCQVTRRETHPGTIERRARASGAGDDEGVLGEGSQDSAGIFEELDLLAAGVCNGRDDLHVLRSITLQAEGREYDGQVDVENDGGGSRDGNRGGDEGDEGGTEEGEHCDERNEVG